MRTERYSDFSGGLNLLQSPTRLKPGESPDLCNLTWDRGALRCRRGQIELGRLPAGVLCCAPGLFHGWMIAHVGTGLRAFKLRREGSLAPGAQLELLCAGTLPETPGVFLPWRETLLYKTRGAYLTLSYDAGTDRVEASCLRDSAEGTNAYVPVIQLNTDPETGAGDPYQPENRLCGDRIVRFTAREGIADYQLPLTDIDLVREVRVNGRRFRDYTVDLPAGIVHFPTAPVETQLGAANNVEIRFRKENEDAFHSVMDCAVGALFSVGQGLCIVLGGGERQPNAWFWSGSGASAMDPTYFPMSQYNLAGSMREPITAFGTQQNRLVIFQRSSLSQAEADLTEVNGRAQIAMRCERISDSVGCELPGSVQSVENHLVWCSRIHGVCRLENRSAAGESAIRVLSAKIHRDRQRRGLLAACQSADPRQVRSVETGQKYLLLVGDAAWEWNHEISAPEDPAWFFHRGIQGIGFVTGEDTLYEVLPSGIVAAFGRVCTDFGGPIEKYYTLPTSTLGGDTRQTTVKSVVFTTRPDGRCDTEVHYLCDFARRRDPTNLRQTSWALSPRDLTFRDLSCPRDPKIFRRHPGLHNARHLTIRLYNNGRGEDLTLLAVTILYTERGIVR